MPVKGEGVAWPLSNRCVSLSTIVQQLKILKSRDGLKISVRKQSDKMFNDFESDICIVMSDDFAFCIRAGAQFGKVI